MTNIGDILFQGQTDYNRIQWPSGGGAGENYGLPQTPQYAYIPVGATGGAPATALPSGVVASQTATAGGTLSMSGTLVSGGVATFDVCRGVAITTVATTTLATCVFTFRGTDFYGATMTHSMIGPTGSAGTSLSKQCFLTISTASVVGLVTAAISVGTSDVYDMPYRVPNNGYFLSAAKGGLLTSTVGPVYVAGQAATFTMTASSSSPRGTVQMPTTQLADGTNFITIEAISPLMATSATPTKLGSLFVAGNNDTVANAFGPLPFSN